MSCQEARARPLPAIRQSGVWLATMRFVAILVVLSCGPARGPSPAAPVAPAAADAAFEPVLALLGHWQGGDPDRGSSGEFTFAADLGGKVLVRRSHNESPQGRHEDLMIVFPSPEGLRAMYFDNEGHAINYAVTATNDYVELLSDEVPNQPRFRLRYDVRGRDELAIEFGIAMPGSQDFKHYTGGVVHRVRG